MKLETKISNLQAPNGIYKWLKTIIPKDIHFEILTDILQFESAGTTYICKNSTIAGKFDVDVEDVKQELKEMVNLGYIRIEREFNKKMGRIGRTIISEEKYLKELYMKMNHPLQFQTRLNNMIEGRIRKILQTTNPDEIDDYCLDVLQYLKYSKANLSRS